MATARILVVDDDQATLDLMQEILSEDGHEVHCVPAVSADLREILAAPPDLLIVDLLLSEHGRDLSGWDLVRLVKSHRGFTNLQILVVSADYPTLRGHIAEAAEMDGVRLLTKPFSLDSLSVLVRDALRSDARQSTRSSVPAIPPRPPYPRSVS